MRAMIFSGLVRGMSCLEHSAGRSGDVGRFWGNTRLRLCGGTFVGWNLWL